MTVISRIVIFGSSGGVTFAKACTSRWRASSGEHSFDRAECRIFQKLRSLCACSAFVVVHIR